MARRILIVAAIIVSIFVIDIAVRNFGVEDGLPVENAGTVNELSANDQKVLFGTLTPERLENSMRDIERLKKQYPFVSLRSRLQFANHRSEGAHSLTKVAETDLKFIEQTAPTGKKNYRAESLRLMHEETVRDFAQREGFGVYRISPPSRPYIEQRERQPIRLASDSVDACDESEFVMLDPSFNSKSNPEMPTAQQARTFHRNSVRDFGDTRGFGYIASIDKVSGFQSHGFSALPPSLMSADRNSVDPLPSSAEAQVQIDPDLSKQETPEWTLNRLELVSLLKFAEPRVYNSDELPRMDALENAPTRPLTKFEHQAYSKLQAGEMLIARAAPTRVEMVGAIRAAKQCMQCHEVKRGTLLGAFTYVLTLGPEE